MTKNPREKFERYQELMRQKFDLEDKIIKNNNAKWRLCCENVKLGKQKALIQDQIRLLFNRKIIKEEKNIENGGTKNE